MPRKKKKNSLKLPLRELAALEKKIKELEVAFKDLKKKLLKATPPPTTVGP
jgi:hypothetical protein